MTNNDVQNTTDANNRATHGFVVRKLWLCGNIFWIIVCLFVYLYCMSFLDLRLLVTNFYLL